MDVNAAGSAQHVALEAFPELRRLIDLRDAGWLMFPRVHDGQIVEIRGVRAWPDGWSEAIVVRYVTDAAAIRVDPDDGTVWRCAGGLTEVIDQLFALPAPNTPGAPRLVLALRQPLWTP